MVRCMRVDSGLPPFLWGELMVAASYICNRIPYAALNMETPYKNLYGKDADLSHLKIIGARASVHIKNPNKLGHTSWEGIVCGFSETESNSHRIWNPKTRRVVENRNVVFIETSPNVLPATRRLSPQQDPESPSYDFSDDTLDDNYVSHDDMMRNVQNYTFTLDFGVDTPAGAVELLLPQQVSTDVTSPGGASPAEISPGGVTPEVPSPPPAPTPAFAARRATNGHANHGTVGVTPAVTRSRAVSVFPVHVATRYGGGRSNNRATLAELFEAGTLQRLSKLELGTPCYTEDTVHQGENANFNVEYAYVATNALGRFSGGQNKKQIPNTFKKANTLPQAARWKVASYKEIASLEKHGVYELISITSVPNGRQVVGTRWVHTIKNSNGANQSRVRLCTLGRSAATTSFTPSTSWRVQCPRHLGHTWGRPSTHYAT